jgi:hypothetical protein
MSARRRGPGGGEVFARPALIQRETEAGFQGWLTDYAQLHGWRVAYFRAAQSERGWRTPVGADGAGWPDLALARPPYLILAELKSQTGRLGLEQAEWLNVLAGCHHLETHLWRPSDRDDIEGRLGR